MNAIIRRVFSSRSSNAFWYIYYTCKLVECNFVVRGSVDGCSLYIMWIKFLNNNIGVTACRLFKEAITDRVLSLQVPSDKGSANKAISKCVVTFLNSQGEGFIVDTSTHNTIIEKIGGSATKMLWFILGKNMKKKLWDFRHR